MTWIIRNTDTNVEIDLILVPTNPNLQYDTSGIYNASIVESSDNNITSVLRFISPTKLTNNNMEIICARGGGNSEGDRMACPFIIEGIYSMIMTETVYLIFCR